MIKHLKWTFGLALLITAFAAGCNKPAPPPEPIPAAELPAAMDKAFASSAANLKALAAQVARGVESQDYAKAFTAHQALVATPGLSKEQVALTARVTLTMHELLQKAQAQGNVQATRTLENYRSNK